MMNDYFLGLYEKAMPDQISLHEKLLLTKQSGFDFMEISIDETDLKLARLNATAEQIQTIKDAMDSTGIYIRTMCLSGHRKYSFGSHEPKIREQSLQIMEKSIEFAYLLGIRLIQLAGYDVYYEQSDETTRSFFAENLKKAVRMAASRGIVLGFETMETPFMNTVEKAMGYVEQVNSPYLGVYPDLGNLTSAAVLYGTQVVTDLEKGSGHIFAAHLKETKPGLYRNVPFGTGHTDYVASLAQLHKQGVRLFVGEFWHQGEANYLESLTTSALFLRNKIEAGITAAITG